MSTTLDEQDRQKKQAEMIRQYLQITNIDSNPQPVNNSSANIPPGPKETQTNLPVRSSTPTDVSSTKMKKFELGTLSLDLNKIRREVEQAEERVERLRQEVNDLQKKREENVLRSPPTSLFISFPSSTNRCLSDRTTPPPPVLSDVKFSSKFCRHFDFFSSSSVSTTDNEQRSSVIFISKLEFSRSTFDDNRSKSE